MDTDKLESRNVPYTLGMHEEHRLDQDTYIVRVPGGWIYKFYVTDESESFGCCFVPYTSPGISKDDIARAKRIIRAFDASIEDGAMLRYGSAALSLLREIIANYQGES